MVYSFAETIRTVAEDLPPQLLSAQEIDNVTRLMLHIPDALSFYFGFECGPSGERPTEANFLMKVAPSPGREILAGLHPTIALPEFLFDHPQWAHLRAFCREWTNASSVLAKHVQGVWLAFATDGSLVEIPSRVFLTLGEQEVAGRVPDLAWIREVALPLLRGAPLPCSLDRALAACFEGARPAVQIVRVGYGEDDVVVLSVYPTSKEDLLAYLANQGWMGPFHELEAILSPLYLLAGQVCLLLEIGGDLSAKIGLECSFSASEPENVAARWSLLLAHLVENGIWTAGQRDALLNFPGHRVVNFLYERLFLRGLHHLTVIYQPGHALEARVYIRYMHRPLAH